MFICLTAGFYCLHAYWEDEAFQCLGGLLNVMIYWLQQLFMTCPHTWPFLIFITSPQSI